MHCLMLPFPFTSCATILYHMIIKWLLERHSLITHIGNTWTVWIHYIWRAGKKSHIRKHRMVWTGLERTSGGHLVQPFSGRTIYSQLPEPCPDILWIAARKETSQHLWAACSSALWQMKTILSFSKETSCVLLSTPSLNSGQQGKKSLAPSSSHSPFRYL